MIIEFKVIAKIIVYLIWRMRYCVAGQLCSYLLAADVQKFKSAFILNNGGDANFVKANSFIANASNLPESKNAGFLEVLWSESTGGRIQRFIPYPADGSVYVRNGDGTAWTAWCKV